VIYLDNSSLSVVNCKKKLIYSSENCSDVTVPVATGSKDRSNAGIVGSNPARFSFLCCAVLCRYRPCDGPIPRPRSWINSFRS